MRRKCTPIAYSDIYIREGKTDFQIQMENVHSVDGKSESTIFWPMKSSGSLTLPDSLGYAASVSEMDFITEDIRCVSIALRVAFEMSDLV